MVFLDTDPNTKNHHRKFPVHDEVGKKAHNTDPDITKFTNLPFADP